MRIVLTSILLSVSIGCSGRSLEPGGKPAPAPFTALPSNPCEILGKSVVAATIGGEVTSAERVASIGKTVEAQNDGRRAAPGTLCDYRTKTQFGSIILGLPIDNERGSEAYWSDRQHYFDTFRNSAKSVAGLGEDAWIGGGSSLHVLIRRDAHFTLSTQLYQRDSEDVLIELAQAVLKRVA